MRKKWLIFFALASACVLMLAMTTAPQARRAKIIRPVVKPAAAAADWSTPVNIANTPTLSASPFLDLDEKGKVYVTWVEWTGFAMARNMMFNTNESGNWAPSKAISPILYDGIDDVGFPTIAVSPEGGKAYVGYHDGDFSRMLMSIMLWEYSGGNFGSRQIITNDASASCSYVTLAVSPTNKYLYAIFMADVGGFNLAFKYLDPNTQQWAGSALLPFADSYLPNMCIDSKGTAHLVWIKRPNEAIAWYSKNPTPKNDATWTSPVQISPSSGLNWTYPKVAADADGEAYVVWHDVTTGNSEVFLRRTVNGVWQAAENISQTPDLSETPTVAVHGATKEIYIAWQELKGETNWEVFAKTYEEETPNGPKKWSNIINFSNSPGYSGEPSFRATANGDVHLVYYDTIGPNWEIMYTFKEEIKIYPPLDVALTTKTNKILFYSEKINTITFSKNSQNAEDFLDSYKVYRKRAEDSNDQFQLLTTLNSSTFKYDDKHLPLTQKYAYAVTAVDKGGNESEKVAVTEK